MDQTLVIAIAAALLWAADRLGWIPSKKSSADAAGELAIAETTIARLRTERDTERQRADQLALERTNEPVLALVNQVFETQQQTLNSQQQTLEKLAHFNGALKRNEEGLREATEALRMVAGLVVSVADLPMKEKP